MQKSIKKILACKPVFNYMNYRPIYLNSSNMEKVMETIEKNPFYGKYASKISVMKNESPEDFLSRAEAAFQIREDKSSEQCFSKPSDKKKSSLPSAFAPQNKLESIMKLDLLKNRTSDEIKYIWTKHFAKEGWISGIMPSKLFEVIQDRSVQYPVFIFPLPRDQGYEFIYAQFAANEIHFTSLINYQSHQENAPECLTMVHYPELSGEKGIVLMRGEFNMEVLSAKEAQFLANQVTLYYGGNDDQKLELMRRFHASPSTFKHTDLIDQIEKLDLGMLAAY